MLGIIHNLISKREVEIYKLISKETIDESMLKIQQHKLLLDNNLTDETDEQQSKKDMLSLLKEAIKTKN
jgi:SNF2 family DNA or RNA helicase